MRDLGHQNGLIELIQAIDALCLPISCRILYLYPTTTTLELIHTIAQSKSFLPYFDMPIQHIADSMLRRMKRGMNSLKHIEILKAMRDVEGSFLRTSFVIGHPGESDEEFEQLCQFVQEFNFDRANLFAYSPQEGTSSFMMQERISTKLTNTRLNALNKIIKTQQKVHFQNLLGQEREIIIEGKSDVSEYFYKARLKLWGKDIDGEILINDSQICDKAGQLLPLKEGYYTARITDYKDGFLFAQVLR